MLWLILILISALALSVTDALSKKISADVSDLVNVGIRFIYAVPFSAPLLLAVEIPPLDRTFWLTLFATVPLEITAWALYVRALRLSPLSLTVPFLGLTPVFLLLISWLLLGETVSWRGGLGVMMVAIGVYLLNANRAAAGLLGPIRAIGAEPGSRLMAVVAAIFSVTATLGKILVLHSSPLFTAAMYCPLLALIMAPAVLSQRAARREVVQQAPIGLLIGFTFALSSLTHFFAVQTAVIAYVVAVKRASLLFAVLWGWLFFDETRMRERLTGATVIVLGVLLTAAG